MDSVKEEMYLKKEIEKICADAFQTVDNARQDWELQNNNIPEAFMIAQCIVQMICLKAKTILSMTEGVCLIKGTCRIIDFSLMLPLVRTMYELCFILRCFFVLPETREEMTILLSIWKIRGLACRQNMCDIPDKFLQKQKQEKEDITKLRNDVNTLLSNLDISTEVKNDIKKILEYNGDNLKGFVFVKENNRITRIDDIHFADGLKILPELQNTSSLYKWTSMHTHASFLGILQFGQAYTSTGKERIMRSIIASTYLICNTVLSDFKMLLNKKECP